MLFIQYPKCTTCKKAKNWLDEHNIQYTDRHIVEENPTYEEVYTDLTGFAETVKVVYDSNRIDLKLLVELFFKSIDPLSLNRQGNDIGTRYRTGIYYVDDTDLSIIRQVYDRVVQEYGCKLCVELEPLQNFYLAENYHQDYLDKNPNGYCHLPTTLFEFARKQNR